MRSKDQIHKPVTPGRRVSRASSRAGAIVAIAVPTAVVLSVFPLALMLLDSTTAGGDMASHNLAAAWLRTLLLEEGRLTAWVPDNFAGFPLFQMYFPLPFVLMVLASPLVGLNVAFKLTTAAGVVGLPATAFWLLRRLGAAHPAPAMGASFVVLFLLQGGNSMWGGNVASTLAGEFAYSISLLLALAWFALHDKAVEHPRTAAAGAVVIALLALTHAYTALWAAIATVIVILVHRVPRTAAWRLALVFLAGGALCAFWLGPLVAYAPWTTAFRHLWVIGSVREILPVQLWPVTIVLLLELVRVIVGRDWYAWSGAVAILPAGAVAAALAYVAAPSFGIVDVRFLPPLQLAACLMAAVAVGRASRRAPAIAVAVVTLGVALLVAGEHGRMQGWAAWNYEGFERKSAWPVYKGIVDELAGSRSEPRVAVEHSAAHDALGTIRAFENLPLFSGRATLEGVNLQASVTAPFIFFIQSEVSETASCPFAEWGCSRPDLAAGLEHLRLFNVSDLVLRSDRMKAMALDTEGLDRRAAFGPYEIYTIEGGGDGVVVPLAHVPYAVASADWKADAYAWFKRATRATPVPVWVPPDGNVDPERFAGVFAAVPTAPPLVAIDAAGPTVREVVESQRIVVSGVEPGLPLLIRVSYHPRWRTSRGERVWLAGPGFMLVFPESDTVELVYGRSGITTASTVVSLLALVVVGGWLVRPPRRRWQPVAETSRVSGVFLGVAGLVLVIAAAAGVRARQVDPETVYRAGIEALDDRQMDAGVAAFREVRRRAPLSGSAIHATYFEAITLFRQERWAEARGVFLALVDAYPEAAAAAESLYHAGVCAANEGDAEAADRLFVETEQRFPGTRWAELAAARRP